MEKTDTQPELDIIHEDSKIVVINKPAGLLSQKDQTGDPDVLSLCKEHFRGESGSYGRPFAGLIHRIDRPVSGLMVVAKTAAAAAALSRDMRSGAIRKYYLAVVTGIPPENGVLLHYLMKNQDEPAVQVVSPGIKLAKRAELSFIRQSYNIKENFSLVKVRLLTGRRHQIRVQFSESGYPICGDTRYGAASAVGRNIALHSFKLGFKHPENGTDMTFLQPPDPIWPWTLFDREFLR